MIWNSLDWLIVRENAEDWMRREIGGEGRENVVGSVGVKEEISVFGRTGSIWGTREFRLKHFNSDEPAVANIFLADHRGNQTFTIDVKCIPTRYGAQAGIVYYVDDMNYIKLVIEGDRKGESMIILAIQAEGEPEVVYKLENYSNDEGTFHSLSLRVSPLESGTLIEFVGDLFESRVESSKILRDGRYGFMAHSLETAESEGKRWASFRNPSFSDKTPANDTTR